MAIDLLYPVKMITTTTKKVKDFSKGGSKIFNAAKIFGNSVEDIENVFGKGITLTNNDIKIYYESNEQVQK